MFPFRRKEEVENLDDSPYGTDWDGRRARRRFRRRVVLGVFLVILILIAAAPTIVGMTSLRDAVLALAVPNDAGRITCTSASFGWIMGQSLTGVRLFDAEGQPLATMESASIDRPLWRLATASNLSTLGHIRLDRPVMHLNIREDGSNWENFLAHFASEEDQPLPSMRIEIVDGLVRVEDAAGDAYQAAQVKVDVTIDSNDWQGAGSAFVSEIALAGAMERPPERSVDGAGTAGAVELRLTPAAAGRSQIEVVADRVPLAAIRPWLRRNLPGAMVRGVASVDVRGAVGAQSDGQIGADAAGKIELGDFELAADAFNGDLLEVRQGLVNFDVDWSGNLLDVSRLEVESDWLRGTARLSADRASFVGGASSALAAAEIAVECSIDLAKLSRMLPRAMHLRPGVRVDGGEIEAVVRSGADSDMKNWTGRVSVRELSGSDGQREFRWSQPVELEAVAGVGESGVQLQEASISAPFFSAAMAPVMDGYHGELVVDLDQLAEQVGQFVDLSGWRIRGAGKGEIAILATAADEYRATADMQLSRVDIRHANVVVWSDPQLRLQLEATGQGAPTNLQTVAEASVDAQGQSESIRATLLEPYDLANRSDNGFLRFDVDGPIAAWVHRLRPFLPQAPQDASGTTKATARVRVSPDLVDIITMRCTANDFRLRAGSIAIDENRLELVGDLRWDARARAITSDKLEIQSSTVAARSSDLAIELSAQDSASMRGEVAFQASLERFAASLGVEQRAGVILPQGHAVGQIRLTSDDDSSQANIQFVAQPLNLLRFIETPGSGELQTIPAWSDPRVEGSASLSYDRATDHVQLASLRLDGATMQVTGNIDVQSVTNSPAVRGEIEVDYDEGAAANLVAAYLGPKVRVQGLNHAKLNAEGLLSPSPIDDAAATPPHWSQRWRINASSGWSGADLFGVPVGAAKIDANVANGKLGFQPLSIPVGEGNITIQSRVLLDPGPPELQFASGRMASNVTITPEVADNFLKYAAPILAGTTQTEGTFSIETGGVRIPLDDPKRSDARGILQIHRLSIAPGPIVQELGRTIRQIEAIANRNPLSKIGADSGSVRSITATERSVEVSVFRGRVYHRHLEFFIDDVPVRSSGSVGFDESLDIVIEFDIPAKWFRDARVKELFAGETVQIPIKGTFSAPRVDAEAALSRVLEIGQKAAGRAAEQIIGDELNRALDRLLRPR